MFSWEILLTKGQEWNWFGDPIPVRANPGLVVRPWSRRTHLSWAALRQFARQFSHAEGPQISRRLHHHFLRVRHFLCQIPSVFLRCYSHFSDTMRPLLDWFCRHPAFLPSSCLRLSAGCWVAASLH